MDKTRHEKFPWRNRIVCSAEYQSIYRTGSKLHSQNFVLFAARNDLGRARLGITVSSRVGGAVVRNRVKRLFREIFRTSYRAIPEQFDLVVNAKRSASTADYLQLRDEFLATIGRLGAGPQGAGQTR